MQRESEVERVTISQFRMLEELYHSEDRPNDREVAEMVGISYSTARYYRKRMGLEPVRKWRREKRVLYLVRLKKTGKIIAHGTAEECADALGVQHEYFHKMLCRVRSGENGKYIVESEAG